VVTTDLLLKELFLQMPIFSLNTNIGVTMGAVDFHIIFGESPSCRRHGDVWKGCRACRGEIGRLSLI
jgi:hypothetical protein